MSGPRLSIIPARAATDRALKPRDLQVLCLLGRHTDDLGWCRKSQVKMAEEMDCARSTVFEAVERLVKAGYLERHVQESENGRDSAHVYRVILDPVHPARDRIPDCDSPCRQAGTPAGISAPPAGPEPAPPAGPEPAPINDPIRTTPLNEGERGRVREDAKKIETEGWALLKNWPQFDGMPKEPAMKIWRTLPADERATARRRFLPWLELLRKQHKGRVPAPSTYLTEKLWQAVPDPIDAPPPPKVVTPFSKVWTAVWLARCLDGPGRIVNAPSRFIQSIIDEGGERGHREWLQHQVRHGYRDVHLMADAAARGVGLTLRPEERAIEPHAEGFVAVNAKSDLAKEWRDAFERRGWPSLPDPGKHEWLYFPAGGPESGLAAFELAVRGENDAGRSQAAE